MLQHQQKGKENVEKEKNQLGEAELKKQYQKKMKVYKAKLEKEEEK